MKSGKRFRRVGNCPTKSGKKSRTTPFTCSGTPHEPFTVFKRCAYWCKCRVKTTVSLAITPMPIMRSVKSK
jgi:hypothetical protein